MMSEERRKLRWIAAKFPEFEAPVQALLSDVESLEVMLATPLSYLPNVGPLIERTERTLQLIKTLIEAAEEG